MPPGTAAPAAELVRHLEALAMRALPARAVRCLHGWRLARSAGRIRRINSVQAVDWSGGAQLDRAVAEVEAFYGAHQLVPRFRLTRVSRPEGLDDALAARGWETEAPSDVLVAGVGGPSEPSGPHPVDLGTAPQPAWLAVWLAEASLPDAEERRALVGRLPTGTVYALARAEGRPAGVGLAVVEGAWAGIFAMRTAPWCRRRGVARAVLGALARRAAAMGVGRLYLQLDRAAPAAAALYRSAGFGVAYGYHYRTRGRPAGR